MKWYYVEQGQQAGPVEEAQLEEMRRDGRIQPDTLVWCEGMANWAPYAEAKGEAGTAAPQAPALAPPGAGYTGATVEAVCSQCGRIFPKDHMIRHGAVYVCAACKPVFLQKLAEGARLVTGEIRYAGFWIRFVAKIVDNLLLRFVAAPIGFVLGLVAPAETPEEILVVQIVAGLAGFTVAALYNIIMIAQFGATLGKMLCRIRVISADGGRVGYGKATGRFFAELLSGCPTLFIGYIMVGFDDEKRALHDRICATRVIYK